MGKQRNKPSGVNAIELLHAYFKENGINTAYEPSTPSITLDPQYDKPYYIIYYQGKTQTIIMGAVMIIITPKTPKMVFTENLFTQADLTNPDSLSNILEWTLEISRKLDLLW